MTVLLSVQGNYAVDALVALNSELPLYALDTTVLPELHTTAWPHACDYKLPSSATGHTILVDTAWITRARQISPDTPLQVLETLRERFQKIVLLDCASPFQIGLSNDWMNFADAILKVNGIYRDPEFYYYVLGAPTPDGEWTIHENSRPVSEPMSAKNLAKLHVGLPCTIGIVPLVRQKTRRFYGASAGERALKTATERMLETWPGLENGRANNSKNTVHFAGSLTHVQRLDALRKLQKSGLRWDGGLTRVPEWITGWNGAQMSHLQPSERAKLKQELESEGLLIAKQNRVRYSAGMRDSKAVLSIAGYGEMCFRMAEAWAAHRVLVCQDVSHARTLFPIQNGRNAVFCKPDLSDLIDILDDIECNYAHYAPIAHQGYEDWRNWQRRTPEIIKEGFAPLFSAASSLTTA